MTVASAPPESESDGSLLALHSSGSALGVGWCQMDRPGSSRIQVFCLGRDLAAGLLGCVEEVCPASRWTDLRRLVVSIGPGGFTGTRLTVVMARTLAQQLQLPLVGVGSLLLAARRLHLSGPTWLVQELPRRGLVAGLYGPDPQRSGEVVERLAPRLHADAAALNVLEPAPLQPFREDVAADVAGLLELATRSHKAAEAAPWQHVLPIYPTSPVAGG